MARGTTAIPSSAAHGAYFSAMAGAVLVLLPSVVATDPAEQSRPEAVLAADMEEATPAERLSQCGGDGILEPGYVWCFADPASGGEDRRIEEHLVEMASHAGDGDTIRISIFNWDEQPLADAVIAAAGRDADVDVVFDEYGANCSGGSGSGCSGGSGSALAEPEENPVYRDLVRDPRVDVTTCEKGCLGSNINHNKLFLFDIDGRTSVAVSSANLVANQMEKANSLLQVNGDPELYDFLDGYFDRLVQGEWIGWESDDQREQSGELAGAFLYPRKSDNFERALGEVTDCAQDGSSRVWVTPFTFRPARQPVLDQLVRLQGMGCDVRVMVDKHAKDSAGMADWMTGNGLDADSVVLTNTHNKFMVIDAPHQGARKQTVLTGSHNLNGPSLNSNDEVVLRVTDPEVARAHMDYFEELFTREG